jgi:hypothetical protein
MIGLPSYIDREAWDALLDVRAKLKSPNTVYALKLLLYEVQRIKDAGHDPNEAIKQSVLKGYKDVYQPREKKIEANAGAMLKTSQDYLASEMEHARLAREERRRRMAEKTA